MSKKTYTSIGGQAVMEGVMMRSPHFIALALRKPNQKIWIRSYRHVSWGERWPVFKRPIIRGVAGLLDSLIQGMKALGVSAEILSESIDTDQSIVANTPESNKLSSSAIAVSMAVALLMGIGLFVALPHVLALFLTKAVGLGSSLDSISFHAVDGVIKMFILLSYIYLIGKIPDIKRVFQYHGAEHKSIYTFEKGKALTVDEARPFTTLHPRCGTSFLLFLVAISVLVFSIVIPILALDKLTQYTVVNHLIVIVIKTFLMMPVAGIAYEFIRACAIRMDSWLTKILIWPGLTLQNLTTKEPDDGQLEVALASLRRVLDLEKQLEAKTESNFDDFEIVSLEEIPHATANVAEFAEA